VPGLGALVRRPKRDAMVRKQRGDAFAGPRLRMAGHTPIVVEKAGNQIIAVNQAQLAAAMTSAGVLLRWSRRRLGIADLAVNGA
jgi:hypothetical protein